MPKPPSRGWTLLQKGLLIVAVAGSFQLAFLASMFAIQRAYDRERQTELRQKEVVATGNRLLALLIDVETGMRGYMLTGKADFLEPYQRAVQYIPQQIAALEKLAHEEGRPSHTETLKTRVASCLAFHRENLELIRGGKPDRALDRVRMGLGKTRMDAFRSSMQDFLDEEQRAAEGNRQRSATWENRLEVAAGIGTLANILICVSLILVFSRGFSRRLGVIIENTRRIERKETLAPPLNSTDEIGDLDRRVHEMAAALEQAKDELDHFFTISLDMLCIAGFDGYFKRLNPAWEQILGHSTEELCARPWLDFVHPDDRAATIAEGERLAGDALTIQFENRYRCADGTYRWLLWNAAPFTEAGLIYAVASDITERKQLESSLHDRNAALETANRNLESFSYSVSHDLRAPLRAVGGYARLLEEDYGQTFDDEGRRLLHVVRTEARRMGTLIDDLLAFSRLDRQSLAPSTIDLRHLSEEIVREVQASRPERQVEFQCNGIPAAHADRATIRQVLVNLILNAVKYARPEGPIHVEFAGRQEGPENLYWVKDNGIGFDMKYAEKIFGVFQRLHTDHEFEGTGVGLAIVERIIARHGGRVWAEAQPGQGATFFFTLPAAGGGNQ